MAGMMPAAKIIRLETSDQGTIGVFKLQEQVLGFTMELPKRENRPNVSCIPTGQYVCRRIQSPTFGEVFEIKDVPGRSEILIHPGNTIKDIKGCVCPGAYVGKLDGLRAVLRSKSMLDVIMARLSDVDEFHLTITEQF